MPRRSLLYVSIGTSFACALFAVAPTPAYAEGPASIALQAVIPSGNGGGSLGGTTQFGIGAGYDFGPPIIVPVRATAQFDYNGGSGNGAGSLSTYGFTLGARLTTPFYAGIGIGPYFTSYSYRIGPTPLYFLVPAVGLVTNPPILLPPPNQTATAAAFGTKFTVGDRILSLPGGVSLALEASYQLLPTIHGIDPSAARLGVRLHI